MCRHGIIICTHVRTEINLAVRGHRLSINIITPGSSRNVNLFRMEVFHVDFFLTFNVFNLIRFKNKARHF